MATPIRLVDHSPRESKKSAEIQMPTNETRRNTMSLIINQTLLSEGAPKRRLDLEKKYFLKNILQHDLYLCKKFQVDRIKFEIMVSKIVKISDFEKRGPDDFVGRMEKKAITCR